MQSPVLDQREEYKTAQVGQPSTPKRKKWGPALKQWRRPIAAAVLIGASWTAGAVELELLASAFMIAAAIVAGLPIAQGAVRGLRHRQISIDLLVSIAAVGAIAVGNYWEAAAVTFLFAVGGQLEAATLQRTRAALSGLVDSAPDIALVERGDEVIEVPASSVLPGEIVRVRVGDTVPVDGAVAWGFGAVNEASITGESTPAEKAEGDPMFAGTIVTGGYLRVTATGVGADTTLARIIRRVEEAQEEKAKTARFMERFSQWYTPAIIVLALAVGLVTRDVTLALTLLVISCPGALVISIPVSIVAGVGRAAREGVLVKGGEHLENLARVSVVAFDKTGTITEGRPRLVDVVTLGGALESDVLGWAASVEVASAHPLAAPIIAAARDAGGSVREIEGDVESVAGKGLLALSDGSRVAVGNSSLARQVGADSPLLDEAVRVSEELADQGRTVMIVLVDGEPVGVLGLLDTPRIEAGEAIAELLGSPAPATPTPGALEPSPSDQASPHTRRGVVDDVLMISGDATRAARSIAATVGINTVHAELLPEDKLRLVREAEASGKVVAMVGDGVNDAPALASATVGIAMGAAGSGVAIETADVALMSSNLNAIPFAIRLARATRRIMRVNIAIALITVALLIAGVLAGGVTMALGMFVHEASVLIVIANAMRLLRYRGPARTSRAA